MRHFYVLFFLIASSFNSQSQTIVGDIGVSVSNLSFRFKPEGEFRYEKPFVGVAVSAGLQYYSRQYVDVSGKLGWIQKGGRSDYTRYTYNSAGPELNYLIYSNPVHFKYPVTENIFPFISISPNVQYLFSYSNHFDGLEEMGELRRFTYGIASGLGVNYAKPPFEFGIKGEYYFDFNPVVDFDLLPENGGIRVTTRTYTVSVICSYKL